MSKKYYYTYKITCLKGKSFKDKYYFGQHVTTNLNDGYHGSSSILQNYWKKYGVIEGETYTKEIIAFYNNIEELNNGEFELIGDKYDTDPMCLNLRAGGNANGFSKTTRDRMSKNHSDVNGENNPMYNKNWKDFMTVEAVEERAKKISKSNKGKNVGEHNGMFGKHLKECTDENVFEERNKKISQSRRNTKYMTDGKTIISVKIDQIPYFVSIGYVLGRKIKKAS